MTHLQFPLAELDCLALWNGKSSGRDTGSGASLAALRRIGRSRVERIVASPYFIPTVSRAIRGPRPWPRRDLVS
jgi:hypothetical protein